MRRLFVFVVIAALAGACGGKKQAPMSAKQPAPEEKAGDGAKKMDDAPTPGGGAAPAPAPSDPCEGGEHH
ncbi:MAG TPA: hypothetical protein VN253_04765 [Kofleriaceae bacterium]|nr:hypothetical protein [Kofleriaceae bacterium]